MNAADYDKEIERFEDSVNSVNQLLKNQNITLAAKIELLAAKKKLFADRWSFIKNTEIDDFFGLPAWQKARIMEIINRE